MRRLLEQLRVRWRQRRLHRAEEKIGALRRDLLLGGLTLPWLVSEAAAQAPPPVPALPDTERRTRYTISNQTGPFSVGFAIYGDSTDFGDWVGVYLNGTQVPFTLSSATGPLASIARPITNATITLTSPGTGTLDIVGARRPRRAVQFAENRGVAARDLNQAITDLVAIDREQWDAQSRTLRGVPGDNFAPFVAGPRNNTIIGWDNTGNLTSLPLASAGGILATAGAIFNTRALAAAATIGGSIQFVRTAGFATVGDPGAALYVKVGGSTPGGFQSADGAWWQLANGQDINVCMFGAISDGSTDSSAAFAAAVSYRNTIPPFGGTIWVPEQTTDSFYVLHTGVTIGTGIGGSDQAISLIGRGARNKCSLWCGAGQDTAVLTVNGSNIRVENLLIAGTGSNGINDSTGITTTKPAVIFTENCIDCVCRHVYITGGSNCLQVKGADNDFYDIFLSDCYNGSQLLNFNNTGGQATNWYYRVKSDKGNAFATIPASWAPLTPYSAGTIVELSGWWIQAQNTATSGGSSPTLKNYGVNIPDGTINWQLIGNTNTSAIEFNSRSSESLVQNCDLSGAFRAGIRILDTLDPGNASLFITVKNCVGGGAAVAVIEAAAGRALIVSGCHFGACPGGGATIDMNSWGGLATITNNYLFGAGASNIGIKIQDSAGADVTITNNIITGNTCVAIQAHATNVVVGDNLLLGSTFAVTVQGGGTADYYTITNNVMAGATINDAGPGVHKTISGNV